MIAALPAARAIVGPPRSGKTSRLRALAREAAAEHGAAAVFVSSAPNALAPLAFAILEDGGFAAREIDDVDAAALLEHEARPLLELEWPEILDASVDPEVGGLRSPERFLWSAYRLFRKLREAWISPDRFLQHSLSGAADFYAKPPNFAHHELIAATKEIYRDSLEVDDAELERQRRREIDLAKILTKLFRSYIDATSAAGLLTSRDAVALALDRLTGNEELRSRQKALRRFFFIDDAQELSAAEVELLRALNGAELSGVVLAGDSGSTLSASAATRGEQLLASISAREQLEAQAAIPPGTHNALAQLAQAASLPFPAAEPSVFVARYGTERDEIAAVVRRVRGWLAEGIAPHEIAVLFRSVCDVSAYERALLDADVPAVVSGDVNIFEDGRVLDALALLWNAWDPFAHEWMLRTLQSPAFALSDASMAMLCSEPADPQFSLFALESEDAPTVRPSRWDPKRDLRLGWNVTRGDVDAMLPPVALERVTAFRAMRRRWIASLACDPLDATIRAIWNDALARDGAPGSARERSQIVLLDRLLRRFADFAATRPGCTLGDLLAYVQDRRTSEFESCEDDAGSGVQIRSIAASRGRAFARVAIPDLRAGSFPRWYAPDAFLFSPKYGMIPKENAGDARAARTAKFTYYSHAAKTRERFNDRERRALAYALTRSTGEIFLTASGRVTRGVTAPEFLEELKKARVPGVVACS